LLRLSVKNFTKEKIEELEETIKNLTNQFECLKSKTAKDIWNEELDIFSEKYESWLVELDKRKKKK
jgi:hypothetical protein